MRVSAIKFKQQKKYLCFSGEFFSKYMKDCEKEDLHFPFSIIMSLLVPLVMHMGTVCSKITRIGKQMRQKIGRKNRFWMEYESGQILGSHVVLKSLPSATCCIISDSCTWLQFSHL
jgi:hypothetical protein